MGMVGLAEPGHGRLGHGSGHGDGDSDGDEPPCQSADSLRCCCGRTECVFLRHNCSVLESVEKDVQTAAKLGQTLLERHEAYMAGAERDRLELTDRIEQLETDKKELEAENAKKIEENRNLLDQLEMLNSTVADADTRIKSLEAALQSSQQAARRLEGAAERAADMERHLTMLEMEQASLQNTLLTTESEARSAVQRWRRAERGILDLQEQLEKMEKEAREERERHIEVVGRMEKQRAMERELNTAAGRLKGAAAARSLTDGKGAGGNAVVSHFVRDLLQDNANLQLGIAELREMLVNSNDEIQMLRDQLMYHQPLYDIDDVSSTSTLRGEPSVAAGPASTPRAATPDKTPHTPQAPSVSQSLHIHHHYHVATKAEPKRPKGKKRQSLTSGAFPPPTATPPTPLARQAGLNQGFAAAGHGPGYASSAHAHAHVARDSVSTVLSGPSTDGWSMFSDQQSEFAPSSAPSSPLSNPRNSLFDRSITEVSLPTSPATSIDPMSPSWRMQPSPHHHRKRVSELSVGSFPAPLSFPASVPTHSNSFMPTNMPRPRQPSCPLRLTEESHEPESSSQQEQQSEQSPPRIQDVSDTPDPTPDTAVADSSRLVEAAETEEPAPQKRDSRLLPGLDLHQPAGGRSDFEDQHEAPVEHFSEVLQRRPGLRRVVSHESVISLSGGLDIHTLQARPSQLTIRPLGAAAADTGLSAVVARPTIARGAGSEGKRGSVILRDSLSIVGGGMPPGGNNNNNGNGNAVAWGTRRFGKLVASWRPWASSGLASGASVNAETASTTSSEESAGSGSASASASVAGSSKSAAAAAAAAAAAQVRAPGINQPGAVPGFFEYWATHQRRAPPSKVLPDAVDQEALREGLGERAE